MSDLKLFPVEVSVPPLATAVLSGVDRRHGSVIAKYRLDPDDAPVFQARIVGQGDLLGSVYEPVPGIWSSLRQDGDGYELDVGVRQAYGRSWAAALRHHKRNRTHLLPDYQIRVYLLSFLAEHGV